jgi:hypothetical protein
LCTKAESPLADHKGHLSKDPAYRDGPRQHYRKTRLGGGMPVKVWVPNAGKVSRRGIPKQKRTRQHAGRPINVSPITTSAGGAKASPVKSSNGRVAKQGQSSCAGDDDSSSSAGSGEEDVQSQTRQHASRPKSARGRAAKASAAKTRMAKRSRNSSSSNDDSIDSGDDSIGSDGCGGEYQVAKWVCAVRHPGGGIFVRCRWGKHSGGTYGAHEDTMEPLSSMPGGNTRGGRLTLYARYMSKTHGEEAPTRDLRRVLEFRCAARGCKSLPPIPPHTSWVGLPTVGVVPATVWPAPPQARVSSTCREGSSDGDTDSELEERRLVKRIALDRLQMCPDEAERSLRKLMAE